MLAPVIKLSINQKEVSKMLKLEFVNAVAEDSGYGLEVNGKSLEDIISIALGTKAGNHSGYNSGLPKFKSNCCNVTVIIDPQLVTTHIEDEHNVYHTVKEPEEDAVAEYERIKAENAKADPEE